MGYGGQVGGVWGSGRWGMGISLAKNGVKGVNFFLFQIDTILSLFPNPKRTVSPHCKRTSTHDLDSNSGAPSVCYIISGSS